MFVMLKGNRILSKRLITVEVEWKVLCKKKITLANLKYKSDVQHKEN